MDRSILPPAQILIHFTEIGMGIQGGRAWKIEQCVVAHLANSGLEREQ